MNKPHIYRVKNTVNGKEYIGQHDGSKAHYFAGGKAINQAIKKYGKAAFRREIVVFGDFTKEELDELEIYYIEYFQTYMPDYPEKGYNLTRGGGGKRGEVPSLQTRKLISANSANKRAVVQFDLQGNELRSFRTITEAAIACGVLHSGIYRCCAGEVRQVSGYLWLFADEYKAGKQPVLRKHKQVRSVAQYDLAGKFIAEYPSVSKAAQANGFNESAIRNVLAGFALVANEYQWCYVDGTPLKSMPAYDRAANRIANAKKRTRAVAMFTLEGQLVRTYQSCVEAAQAVGVAVSGVRQCILGKYKHTAGYVFKYA